MRRCCLDPLERRSLLTVLIVAPNGNDTAAGTVAQPLATIQHAIDLATHPGDTIEVRGGAYAERLTMTHSGSKAGYITLQNYPGEHVLLTGAGVADSGSDFGENLITIASQSYLQIKGLEIAHNSGVGDNSDACGIYVIGAGGHIVLANNVIHDITGEVTHRSGDSVSGDGGAGIQVYGTSTKHPYSDITIKGNSIFDCQPGDDETETVTLNGNVSGFLISHNRVHDDNNIGIDMIGGEADIFGLPDGTTGLPVARDGRCVGNRVYNIHANYGGGFAGGIYVDGGSDILIDRNISDANDMGLEIGAENAGYIASDIDVQDNILFANTQAGLAIGGYASTTGRVKDCRIINNTVVNNDTTDTGSGQLDIQYASGNVITNNIFAADGDETLIGSDGAGNVGNVLNNNLYNTPSAQAADFGWNAADYSTLASYQAATGEDANSIFGDPLFVDPAELVFTLLPASPAIGSGSIKPRQFAATDFTGALRSLPPDIGAF